MKKIRCIFGIHKYNEEKETATLVFEDRGEQFYRFDNDCIYCGHHKCYIQSFGGSDDRARKRYYERT